MTKTYSDWQRSVKSYLLKRIPHHVMHMVPEARLENTLDISVEYDAMAMRMAATLVKQVYQSKTVTKEETIHRETTHSEPMGYIPATFWDYIKSYTRIGTPKYVPICRVTQNHFDVYQTIEERYCPHIDSPATANVHVRYLTGATDVSEGFPSEASHLFH